MIELSLSTVAWVSVVLVQALVHYVVFGSRRERRLEDNDLIIEESLSLATNEGSLDTAVEDNFASQDTSFTLSDIGISDELQAEFSPVFITSDKLLDGDEPQNFLRLLTQTGSELIQSRSVECLVQEQMRTATE